ncbi:hypothetical protein DSUL_50379 [Desulfovibrionales bacterium]
MSYIAYELQILKTICLFLTAICFSHFDVVKVSDKIFGFIMDSIVKA